MQLAAAGALEALRVERTPAEPAAPRAGQQLLGQPSSHLCSLGECAAANAKIATRLDRPCPTAERVAADRCGHLAGVVPRGAGGSDEGLRRGDLVGMRRTSHQYLLAGAFDPRLGHGRWDSGRPHRTGSHGIDANIALDKRLGARTDRTPGRWRCTTTERRVMATENAHSICTQVVVNRATGAAACRAQWRSHKARA